MCSYAAYPMNIDSLKAPLDSVTLDHYKQLISSVPSVELIEINVVHSDVLKEIGKRCPLLRVLKVLNHADFDDDGLKNIFMDINDEYEDKIQLEQLDISQASRVGDVGVSFVLSHAPSLKYLKSNYVTKAIYEKHRIHLENGSLENCRKYSLRNIYFQRPHNLLDTLNICTILCPYISSLSIDCLQNNEQLLLCSRFQNLEDLSIVGNFFSFLCIDQFLITRGGGLLSLSLELIYISAEALIEYCPKLCSLSLSYVGFEPLNPTRSLFSESKLSSLKTLAITNSGFSNETAVDSVKLILSNANGIKTVDFSDSWKLNENFVRSLFHLGLFQVHELNFNSSDVTV